MEGWRKDARREPIIVDLEALVPKEHLLRKIEKVMDYEWLYERLDPYYCHDNGRPGTDPVVLVKMVLIQHLFGIPSLRQTYREIQVNVAYRWFLGYGLLDHIPHFATVSYAFCQRFPDELTSEIFEHILNKALNNRMLDTSAIFIDGTHIKASANKKWEKEDIVEAGKPNAAGWLLPDGHNIHRRYPEVAILIPDTMGRACGGLCASCQRMYDFQSERLNFEFETLRPKESWDSKLRRLMTYFEQDTQLRDILITGGDALMSQNKTLKNILEAVYRMAVRKQRANLERPEGEKYAELQRVRLGSRLLAYLPMRINDELVDILREFKEKASAVGVKQFIIQTHFQTPLEVTPEAKEAIRKILSAGWIITNQLVYTVAASRRGHTTRLRQVLNSLGVVCYYTFSVKGFNENYAVFAPNSRSMQEQQEEKIYGQMTPEQAEELYKILETKVSAGINEEKTKEDADTAKQIRRFMRKHHLPFLATDRSVLNLPAIGKSMTFQLVGLTEEGKRILRFEHDGTRHHSPIIDQMGQIYIVENKSLAAYLRQLSKMGEDPEDYASIWSYTKGETEPRFSLYEYPDFPFRITDKMSNLEINNRY